MLKEKSLWVGFIVLLATMFLSPYLSPVNLSDPLYSLYTVFLLLIIGWCAFGVVEHSEALAVHLGEPYGTIILTLSVISIEVALIMSLMLTGEAYPTLARDTMYGVFMIVMTGMVGLTLLLGGWRFHTQYVNAQGAKAYLVVVIPLSIMVLIFPNFTVSSPSGYLSSVDTWAFTIFCLVLFTIFLIIQTVSHSHLFTMSKEKEDEIHHESKYGLMSHVVLLIALLLVVVFLAKKVAVPIDYYTQKLSLPTALTGFIVALLVLSPEIVGAIRATLSNNLQRAMNLALGSVLATISLTVPVVLIIGHFKGIPVELGLEPADSVLLIVTLMLCQVSLGSGKTNVLNGATHFIIFIIYILGIFQATS